MKRNCMNVDDELIITSQPNEINLNDLLPMKPAVNL